MSLSALMIIAFHGLISTTIHNLSNNFGIRTLKKYAFFCAPYIAMYSYTFRSYDNTIENIIGIVTSSILMGFITLLVHKAINRFYPKM